MLGLKHRTSDYDNSQNEARSPTSIAHRKHIEADQICFVKYLENANNRRILGLFLAFPCDCFSREVFQFLPEHVIGEMPCDAVGY